MQILKIVYNTILDALFPRSSAELESIAYSPEEAWKKLPRAPKPPLKDAFSIFAYKDERVSKLVWNIKYKKSAKAIAIGGYAFYKQFVEFTKERRGIIIVPIPITQKRRNERGYNQCELLVDEMKQLDVKNKFIICKDLLERVHHLSRQTLKNREARLESTRGIFAVNEENTRRSFNIEFDIKKTTVVIIDDVITTGSTMKEAMETLRNAGFENVFGLSLAH